MSGNIDKRKIVAIFETEEFLGEDGKTKLSDKGTLDYFGQECGWLRESGIYLEKSLIYNIEADNEWTKYISYVIDWALTHSRNEEDKNDFPVSFEVWKILLK